MLSCGNAGSKYRRACTQLIKVLIYLMHYYSKKSTLMMTMELHEWQSMSSVEHEGRCAQINQAWVFLLEEIRLGLLLPFCSFFVLILVHSVTVLYLLVIFCVWDILPMSYNFSFSFCAMLKPVLASCQGFILSVIHSRPFVICSLGASSIIQYLYSLGFCCCLVLGLLRALATL